jgi:hypothetical protein
MSLSGPKSSRSAEPKSESLRIPCLRQNAASVAWSMEIFADMSPF